MVNGWLQLGWSAIQRSNQYGFYRRHSKHIIRCTGEFTYKVHVQVTDTAIAGGVAFSPNSNVLYVASSNFVWQFDMTAADINASKTTVAIYDGFTSAFNLPTTFYLSQLAPDGMIYVISGATKDIGVINTPDSIGLNCDVCQHCIHLPALNHFTIANHPNYFLREESGSVCDSLTTGVQSLSVQSSLVRSGKLNVFPNPVLSNAEITFTYPSSAEKSILIINNTEGKEVACYSLPQWSSVQHLKLPKLSGGVYLARLVGSKTIADVKFFVE